jgi:hypothetical protein
MDGFVVAWSGAWWCWINEIQVEGNRRRPFLRLRLSSSDDARGGKRVREIQEAGPVDIA